MAIKLIKANISTQTLKFKPGASKTSFQVSVINDSDKFASFQIEVIAAGANAMSADWYNVTPAASAKTPPGASSNFCVTIIDTPVAGFVGKMNLTIRVFSLELRDEDRQLVRLIVESGSIDIPVKVELILREFQAQPQELFEIPVRVFNPNQTPTNVLLQFSGIQPKWLVDGVERRLTVAAGATVETFFTCQLPALEAALSQVYAFAITATHSGGCPSSTQGNIKILPGGYIDFKCPNALQRIPTKASWLPKWKANSTIYELEFYNAGNLAQQVSVDVKPDEDQDNCFLEVTPDSDNVFPGETKQLQLLVSKRRHWFGVSKKLTFETKAKTLQEPQLDIRDDTQILKLKISPLLPLWLQLLIGAAFLFILWWCSWLNPDNPFYGHHRAVTSVQFNGLGDMAASSSVEQKIIRWQIAGFTNPFISQQDGVVADPDAVKKAVRVVRYKPVDNDLIAAGLENGQIQLWNVVGGKAPLTTLAYDKADRVFDLRFSSDSQYLFSAHGSGLVLRWDMNSNYSNTSAQPKRFDFTISSMALVGQAQENLVVAGRYNKLEMWNWKQNKSRPLAYTPAGGQDDYIVSLAVAQHKPNLMASADNKGNITLWNMQPCLLSNSNECQLLQQWSDGHNGKAVRSVALSNNGCYLASAGDDNRVMLWALAKNGLPLSRQGEVIRTANKKFNTVDIKIVKDEVLIISGNDNAKVWFDQRPNRNLQCQ